MTSIAAVKSLSKQTQKLVAHYLKKLAPSGYSFELPENEVMYVSDGVNLQHSRWYIVVKPKPAHVADSRKEEYLNILSQVEEAINKNHKRTVFLTSMLPML
jgi:hypothetical protein